MPIPSERHKVSPLVALIIALAIIVGIALAITEVGKGLMRIKTIESHKETKN
jgi:hypothetical protein